MECHLQWSCRPNNVMQRCPPRAALSKRLALTIFIFHSWHSPQPSGPSFPGTLLWGPIARGTQCQCAPHSLKSARAEGQCRKHWAMGKPNAAAEGRSSTPKRWHSLLPLSTPLLDKSAIPLGRRFFSFIFVGSRLEDAKTQWRHSRKHPGPQQQPRALVLPSHALFLSSRPPPLLPLT